MYLADNLDTLFLDRDGVLNIKIENGYVLSVNDLVIIEDIKKLLAWAALHFKRIVVVTNQRCVGRGLLSIEQLEEINNTTNTLTGSFIDKFYVCPHLDEDNCTCRKPKNGLFLQAAADNTIDFQNSWMIGDSETDLVPAKGLGIHTIFISEQNSRFADKRFNNIGELNKALAI